MPNTQQNTDFSYDDYREDVERSVTIPHCQIISPKDKTLPFGFFISEDKASACEFLNDAPGWEQYDHNFGDNDASGWITSRLKEDKNYLTQWLRVVILRGTPMQAFHPNTSGRSFAVADYYERDGSLTTEAKKVEQHGSDPGFFRASRYLMYFLDPDHQPLHSSPLQFKARGGFGGSFGAELRLFYQEFDKSAFDGALGQAGRLNDQARALEVFTFRLGVRQGKLASGGKGAWYCNIVERLVPTCKPEMVDQQKIVNRKSGGEIKLIGTDWRNVCINKKSELGQKIFSEYTEYADFGKISPREVPSPTPAPVMNYQSSTPADEPAFDDDDIVF